MIGQRFKLVLVFEPGAVSQPRLELEPPGPFLLGRAAQLAHIQALDGSVSSRHAVFSCGDLSTWTVQDLGSLNGTFLDEQAVGKEPRPLSRAGLLRFGHCQASYRLVELETDGLALLPEETGVEGNKESLTEGSSAAGDSWGALLEEAGQLQDVFDLEDAWAAPASRPGEAFRPGTQPTVELAASLKEQLSAVSGERDRLQSRVALLEKQLAAPRGGAAPEAVGLELASLQRTVAELRGQRERLAGELERARAECVRLAQALEAGRRTAGEAGAGALNPAVQELLDESLRYLERFGLSLGGLLEEVKSPEQQAIRERLLDVSAGLLDLRLLLEDGKARLAR